MPKAAQLERMGRVSDSKPYAVFLPWEGEGWPPEMLKTWVKEESPAGGGLKSQLLWEGWG